MFKEKEWISCFNKYSAPIVVTRTEKERDWQNEALRGRLVVLGHFEDRFPLNKI